eukprot:1365067-Prymnesium_polylepis.1
MSVIMLRSAAGRNAARRVVARTTVRSLSTAPIDGDVIAGPPPGEIYTDVRPRRPRCPARLHAAPPRGPPCPPCLDLKHASFVQLTGTSGDPGVHQAFRRQGGVPQHS